MEELKKINATLTLFMKDDKILLGEKKRGFANGTLNGIGGKQDPGETIEQAMIRECCEEVGARPTKYDHVGKIDFDLWYKGERTNMTMYIYKCYEYSGEIKETEEIKPNWYDIDKIPFDRMLSDDIIWLPQVLKGQKVEGKVKFDKEKMLYNDIRPVKTLSTEPNVK